MPFDRYNDRLLPCQPVVKMPRRPGIKPREIHFLRKLFK